MKRQNQQDIFLENKNLLKEKIQDNNKQPNWLRKSNRIIAIILSVFLVISHPVWLTVERAVASNPLEQKVKEESTLVRQESPQEEAPEKSLKEETKLEQELPLEEIK
ncbi:MAG: hypothetical protein MUD14_27670, partial [Hydrococcus sp. Prado102]|nr:hypothetical protein [Hydrococcus sp. Prado102]